ncbi:hypothetical protein BpHYR1_015859 [Brachionus plicatilis]|uniref:Uncharacterized protein n=1 Tax=Brachionus plicatilis TaxID=10195 RepID=A0A3M7PLM9_BRAPC|nr:hypothetical protein BpHYR1_015859 [Brachionus plicatilis]
MALNKSHKNELWVSPSRSRLQRKIVRDIMNISYSIFYLGGQNIRIKSIFWGNLYFIKNHLIPLTISAFMNKLIEINNIEKMTCPLNRAITLYAILPK